MLPIMGGLSDCIINWINEQETTQEETESTETVDFGTNWIVVDDEGTKEIPTNTRSF